MNTPYNDVLRITESAQLKILLLTGDTGMLRKFRQLLTPQYSLLVANTVAEGIAYGYNNQPDMVLCDSLMNDTTGYQFLITLRNDPVLKHIPFILFSRPNGPANMRKGMNLGADDFLVAPFSGEELLKSIQSRLSRYYHIRDTYAGTTREFVAGEINTLIVNDRLSKTEAKILEMIAKGMSSRDIASYKCISVRTVDNHRHNITKKLQLSGPNALVKFAIGYAGAMGR
ncbi:DNA-binding response regulator, NarL/FixJ family, contains REC and HTH domains [Chitinophaga sp. CF118]|uniref:response regulator transcription factor n=1 Tax=Chitinophaga sp. CF118 TaxID=1884367 RepID=UPI0008E21091|nr:response regulator transcription factor [Chitinophaga sp. CF118]SFD80973.1 DNA-binding response regulator, NarL/FixJ family, contains REC and HTH domains [Chitinophaga sp. CF118]